MERRLLKFRAWDPQLKAFGYLTLDGSEVKYDSPPVQMRGGVGGHSALSLLPEWQQFTGLKDRNDKDIYEGDILEYEDLHRYEVIFERGCFKCKIPNQGNMSFDAWYFETGKASVVGNIYANPDLLNE